MFQQDLPKPSLTLALYPYSHFGTRRGEWHPREMTLQIHTAQISLAVTTLVLVFLCTAPSVEASNKKAAEHVRQGIRHFRAGEMQAAERAFAEADVASPENPRIGYDRACVLSATEQAERRSRTFAQGTDRRPWFRESSATLHE